MGTGIKHNVLPLVKLAAGQESNPNLPGTYFFRALGALVP